jgi:citrate synthase
MTEWLSAGEAMERLGVRAQTLYAYVSRGRIEARVGAVDPRKSLYRAEDIDRLRQRKARGRKAAHVAEDAIAWGEPVLASAITTVREGQLYYRGRNATDLARTESLESVARLLRGGHGAALKQRTAMAYPVEAGPRARAVLALASRAAADAPARGRAALALAAEAAGLLDGFADAVAGEANAGPIHARLAGAWRLDAAGAELIRMTLVLLADHELNTSTFAARVGPGRAQRPVRPFARWHGAPGGSLHRRGRPGRGRGRGQRPAGSRPAHSGLRPSTLSGRRPAGAGADCRIRPDADLRGGTPGW